MKHFDTLKFSHEISESRPGERESRVHMYDSERERENSLDYVLRRGSANTADRNSLVDPESFDS